ncbi:acyl carrier protein [Frankia sp. QA3]|uniref:acyl carrier protein n=1 Tax=Frankia sp. QA3 TaxID=710111 RepID=UPI000269BEB5|nr:acyl carrier protein [Frankia sp. QA3]EIV91890.1 acyl carrier protein [Frankia sp. QA3]
MGAAAREGIAQWCREHVADILEQPVSEIDLDADFDRLGVDSAVAVSLLIAVEDHYGVDVAPEALFDNPTLKALAAYLHDRGAREPGAPAPAPR